MPRGIVYDADREEPDCLRCDKATVIIDEKGNETPKIFTEMDFN